MTVESLIEVTAVIGIPAITAVAWLITMLMSIKADLKKIEVQLELKNTMYDERITRLERSLHEARNSIQELTLSLARKGLHDEQQQG
jgi:type II secretory pathway pseudopilin PulG